MKELRARKNIRLKDYDYSTAGYYFVTICVKNGYELLGKIVETNVVGNVPPRVPYTKLSEIGAFVDEQIQKTNDIYPNVEIDKYVIMPNHVHAIVIISKGTRRGTFPTNTSISQTVQSIKSMTTKKIGYSIWQKSFYDHIIRNETDYQRICSYINENPAKWTEDKYFVEI